MKKQEKTKRKGEIILIPAAKPGVNGVLLIKTLEKLLAEGRKQKFLDSSV